MPKKRTIALALLLATLSTQHPSMILHYVTNLKKKNFEESAR